MSKRRPPAPRALRFSQVMHELVVTRGFASSQQAICYETSKRRRNLDLIELLRSTSADSVLEPIATKRAALPAVLAAWRPRAA